MAIPLGTFTAVGAALLIALRGRRVLPSLPPLFPWAAALIPPRRIDWNGRC